MALIKRVVTFYFFAGVGSCVVCAADTNFLARVSSTTKFRDLSEIKTSLQNFYPNGKKNFEENQRGEVIYTSMLYSKHQKSGSKVLMQATIFANIRDICISPTLSDEELVLAGWWLMNVSPKEVYDDSPPKSITYGTIIYNGKLKKVPIEHMGPNPDIARGKKMIEKIIAKNPNTLFGNIWQLQKKDRNAELRCIKWADDKKHPCRAILLSNLARFASKLEVREECKSQLKLYYPKSVLTKIAFGDSLD